MTFTKDDKLKALAIVNIFETSHPLGGYSTVAVLDDGAGISYGFAQFTHRSGALCEVVERYLANGGKLGPDVLTSALPLLTSTRTAAIESLAANAPLKNALRAAAVTREMKEAQHYVAERRYLRPAIKICERRGFVLPLSLAVVYDSVIHGSFERIAAHVDEAEEKAWITEYVRRRDRWLDSVPRLRPTRYRTKFFLAQIMTGNWQLQLPLSVHGICLKAIDEKTEPTANAANNGSVGAAWDAAAARFDRVDSVVTGVVTRTDRAKSLWTTIIGTLTQAAWAVFGFLAGLPREVWIVVAVIAGLLTVLYLYRQITLGRIRERTTPSAEAAATPRSGPGAGQCCGRPATV